MLRKPSVTWFWSLGTGRRDSWIRGLVYSFMIYTGLPSEPSVKMVRGWLSCAEALDVFSSGLARGLVPLLIVVIRLMIKILHYP